MVNTAMLSYDGNEMFVSSSQEALNSTGINGRVSIDSHEHSFELGSYLRAQTFESDVTYRDMRLTEK